ncbi:hypothetical protein [Nonomuraea longispora]|uniref:hypothetical protein n=1 Tax=Nonomuraea longispora TaxID=1848320 RepID=UPI0015F2B103|nr:hypothetical protein [Nonomuraea longispora]
MISTTPGTEPGGPERGRIAYTLAYYLGSGVGGTTGGHAGWTWLVVVTSAWLLLAGAAVLLPRFLPRAGGAARVRR